MKVSDHYRLVFLLTLLPAIWSSCKVSKDVAVPDLNLPANYREAQSGGDTSIIGKMAWSTFFSDPDLQMLLRQAIDKNNDLQVAVKNIEAARLLLRQAGAGNLPVIGIQAAAAYSRPSDNSLNGKDISQALGTTHVEDYNLGVYLSWEADIWGKIRSQKAGALASYLQTEEARKAVQTRLVSEVAKGYYHLKTLDTLLQIAQQNLRLNDSTLTIIQMQFNAGQVTLLAVQQATAQRLTAAELIPGFEQSIRVQENALSVLTGVFPGEIKRNYEFSISQVAGQLSAGVPSALLGRRPDVKLAEYDLSRANAQVGYAKAQLYPSLTITAQSGLDAIKSSNWFNIPASLFGNVAGSLTQPLLNQRKLRTQYEIARVRRDQSVIRFRQSVLVAVEDVSDALVKLDRLKHQQEFEAQRVLTLQQAIRNSQLLFRNGMASYLEVIVAQGNVLQSELQLVNIQNARLDAMVDLYRSVGGGWR